MWRSEWMKQSAASRKEITDLTEITMAKLPDSIDEYRKMLIEMEQRMQTSYDKAVMTLSGGALGISLAFTRDIADKASLKSTGWLLTAWILWGLSITIILASFFTSSLAIRKAIRQTDEQSIYREFAGGVFNRITSWMNPLAGGFFFFGIVAIVIFIGGNIK